MINNVSDWNFWANGYHDFFTLRILFIFFILKVELKVNSVHTMDKELGFVFQIKISVA